MITEAKDAVSKRHTKRRSVAVKIDGALKKHNSRPNSKKGQGSSRSTARSLLKYAGTWVGNDLEKCLKAVYAARGEVEF